MPSGNKIIGQVHKRYMNLEIYISSKTLTEGLCGSFDRNRSNDLFERFTQAAAMLNHRVIDVDTSRSWRYACNSVTQPT